MTVEKARIVEAVNYLIEAKNYGALIREITKIIEDWDRHPMVYAGQLECLNALIDVGVANREAFERLLRLAESRRELMPEIKRVDYQRNLMRERRARIAKAVELHELQYGRMADEAKKRFVSDIQKRWKRARDQFIREQGDLDWKGRNEAANEFWADVDRKLDLNIRSARQKPRA